MTEAPAYPTAPLPAAPLTRGEQSAAYEGAFSKPGSTKSKGWAPAKGVRFRSVIEKSKGRRAKKKRDSRNVKFY